MGVLYSAQFGRNLVQAQQQRKHIAPLHKIVGILRHGFTGPVLFPPGGLILFLFVQKCVKFSRLTALFFVQKCSVHRHHQRIPAAFFKSRLHHRFGLGFRKFQHLEMQRCPRFGQVVAALVGVLPVVVLRKGNKRFGPLLGAFGGFPMQGQLKRQQAVGGLMGNFPAFVNQSDNHIRGSLWRGCRRPGTCRRRLRRGQSEIA